MGEMERVDRRVNPLYRFELGNRQDNLLYFSLRDYYWLK